MPKTNVIFYKDEKENVLVLDWLDKLSNKARRKCLMRLEMLEELGHEIRRPAADYLRDGIYELRASSAGIHNRILYFFHGTDLVVVSHGIKKEKEVPLKEIEKAVLIKKKFESDPERYSFNWSQNHEA